MTDTTALAPTGSATEALDRTAIYIDGARGLVPVGRLGEAEAIARRVAETYQPADPMESTTLLGPMVSATQRERVRDYIETGVKEGARLVTDGPEAVDRPGYFVGPTVFSRVTPEMRIGREAGTAGLDEFLRPRPSSADGGLGG